MEERTGSSFRANGVSTVLFRGTMDGFCGLRFGTGRMFCLGRVTVKA